MTCAVLTVLSPLIMSLNILFYDLRIKKVVYREGVHICKMFLRGHTFTRSGVHLCSFGGIPMPVRWLTFALFGAEGWRCKSRLSLMKRMLLGSWRAASVVLTRKI